MTAAPRLPILRFARDNAPWLGAGALMTFGSSFGQTFFISLFAGEIRAEFGLGHGDWGAAYALGTLASATLMLWAGGLTDRLRAGTLTAAILCLLAVACLAMAGASGFWSLTLAVFGLRFCGQGMLFHTAIVSMGRWFQAARGRAVAISHLGIAAGEAMLPVIFAALIVTIGWRASWGVAAACALALAPAAPLLLRAERTPRSRSRSDGAPGMEGRHWPRAAALRHWLFWATFPAFLAPPVISTAFFFHQVHMCQEKGWALLDFAALYPLYVAAASPSTFLGGWLTDRFGAARLAPLYMAPMAAALLVVASFDGLWAGGAALALLGMTNGLGAAVGGAFWPEFYGTRHLGAIRAVAMSAMVFASAVGPAATGWLIDAGLPYDAQLAGLAVYTLAMCAALGLAMARAARSLPARA